MAETPYAETEALLAMLNDDEDEALRILGEMYPRERRALVEKLDRLSLLAEDRFRCPRCRKPVEPISSVSVGHLGEPRAQWHRECLATERAEKGGA